MKIDNSTIGLGNDRLTVIGPGFFVHDGKRNQLVAVVECACGATKVMSVPKIRSKRIHSCGCLQREAAQAWLSGGLESRIVNSA